jgi:hypothetical protein
VTVRVNLFLTCFFTFSDLYFIIKGYKSTSTCNLITELSGPQPSNWLTSGSSYVTTDSRSINMPWCRTHSELVTRGYFPSEGFCHKISFLSLWGTLSDERSVLSLSKSKILRPTVSRPVRLGVRHPSGTRNQFFPFSLWLFLDICGFVDVGCPLWLEVRSVVFSVCQVSLAQPQSQSYITTDSRSVRLGVSHPSGTHDQFFPFFLWSFLGSCRFVCVGDGSVICRAMTQVQCQVILRLKVCQPVHLGAGPPMRPLTRF